MSLIELEKKDQRAELALLVKMESLPSAGHRRAFAAEISLPWEEYLRLCRKWRVVLERWKKEGGDISEQTKAI